MTRLNLTLLGDFQARLGTGAPLRLRTRKTQALLAYLALPGGQAHTRDKLSALLWDDRSPHQARSRLRETLFALRRSLAHAEPPCLDFTSDTLALNADAVDVDAVAFERLVDAADPESLARAVDLYQGDLLEGLAFRGALFEDWLMAERERLREMALDALAKLLAHQHLTGPPDAALPIALRLIALDPLQEAVHRTLMRLYCRLGRRGSALRQYQICTGVLRRELGVEPEADTRRLYQEILLARPRSPREPGGGAGQARTAPDRLAPSPFATAPTPLIGREAEMVRLREALDRAREGHGQFVMVVGEAGIGKSRLIAEIATEALGLGAQLLLGRCHEGEQILPFGPWVDALRERHIADDAVLRELGPTSLRALARLLPQLGPLDAASSPSDHLRLFETVTELVGRLAARHPQVLLLEDLQWADDISVRLLCFLGRRLRTQPVLVLGTARNEDVADSPALREALEALDREAHVVRFVLGALSRLDTLTLVSTLARSGSENAELVAIAEQVWRASEGNPFVIVEAMRALGQGSPGPGSASALPQRVLELIGQRLDRLSERSQHLATVAAVIGRSFEFALLHAAAGLAEDTTAEGVEELVRRHVLHSAGDHFDFTHERIRITAYTRLLPPRRKLLHRRVAESLEALYANDLDLHAVALGSHYRQAEIWDKAFHYLWQAGTQAAARFANREAAASLEAARAILPHLPDTPARLEQETDLLLDLRMPIHALGDLERGHECAREAERLAGQLGDSRRLARASVSTCHYSRLTGRLTDAAVFGRRALAIAEEFDDLSLAVAANFSLGLVHSSLGDYSVAEALLRTAMQAAQGDRRRDFCGLDGLPSVMVPGHLARVLAECGRFEEGARLGREAIRVAETLDHPYSLVMACWGLGWQHNIRGEVDAAIALLERALAIAIKWEYAVWLPNGWEQLGYAYACAQRMGEGLELLERAVMTYESEGRYPLTMHLGEAYLEAGQLKDATAHAERALARAQAGGERRMEALALSVLAEIAARRDPPQLDQSLDGYRQALRLAEKLGMRPLAARCFLGLGTLAHKAGQQTEALRHLATGANMFREMGMVLSLQKRVAPLFLEFEATCQKSAIGFAGEPVPPRTLSGAMTSMNSSRPSS